MRYLILFLLLPFSSTAIEIQARFDHAAFYAPSVGHYMETYLSVTGHSIKYLPNDNGILQGKVLVTQILKKGDEIMDFKKVELMSPELPDSVAVDFADVQRFQLEPGDYIIEILLKDLNKPESKEYEFSKAIQIESKAKGCHFSDIELLESITRAEEKTNLTKAGYNLVPLVDNFFPPEIEKIAFYTEVYNSDKVIGRDDRFLLKVSIRDYDSRQTLSNYGLVKKYNTETVNPVLELIDIKDLPSGKYNLIAEVINRSNESVAVQSIYFERFNPIANMNVANIAEVEIQSTFVTLIESEDSLNEYIASLRPITTDLEKRIMDKEMEEFDLEMKRQFFYAFWNTRNSENPEDEWNKYRAQVREVEAMFSTQVRHGYETDRGRIYLRYGKPDYTEARPNEPSTYPYEMWQYYRIENFNNRMFIFYMPDLVTNDYVLLHSDMQGEVQNYRWKTELSKRNTPFQDIDAQNDVDHFGGRSGEVFDRSR